ncbi:MAG: DNA repair protein RadC [Bacillota bacterium]
MTYPLRLADLPTEERPRERLLAYGAEALSNTELLALLIGGGVAGQNALDLAARVLVLGQGSLRQLRSLSVEELSAVKGIGEARAARLKAAVELGRRVAAGEGRRPIVKCPGDAHDVVKEDLKYQDREHFRIIMLNTKHHVLCTEVVSIGSLASSIVHPREIFKTAIRRNAAAVILAHNHPSGDPTPSPEDLEVTRRLTEAGSLLGIEVLDHIIVGDNSYTSLREQGLI